MKKKYFIIEVGFIVFFTSICFTSCRKDLDQKSVIPLNNKNLITMLEMRSSVNGNLIAIDFENISKENVYIIPDSENMILHYSAHQNNIFIESGSIVGENIGLPQPEKILLYPVGAHSELRKPNYTVFF